MLAAKLGASARSQSRARLAREAPIQGECEFGLSRAHRVVARNEKDEGAALGRASDEQQIDGARLAKSIGLAEL